MALGSFTLQRQAFLGVEPIDFLVIDPPALTPQKDVEPAVTVADTDACDLMEALSESGLGRPDAAVPNARAMKPEHLARATLADLVGRGSPAHELALERRPQSFFLRPS
jgi:hypothetical protein